MNEDRRFIQDYAALAESLAVWLTGYVHDAGFSRVVLGVSGGVDSAVSAALASRLLGPSNVHGLLLPHAESDPASEADGLLVCQSLGLPHERVDITPLCAPLLDAIPAGELLRRGNVKARTRMIVLYDYSAEHSALVLGTGNLTEIMLGYTTLYGDDACALDPLASLYKTEVRRLARELNLPERIITKPPSADLWPGQTDEDELGVDYADADRILHDILEGGLNREGLLAAGHPAAAVRRVLELIERSSFKRSGPARPPSFR